MKTFMVMVLILSIAHGVFMHSLLFPSSLPSWKILFSVLFRPYLLLFGELGLESYERKYFHFFICKETRTLFIFPSRYRKE